MSYPAGKLHLQTWFLLVLQCLVSNVLPSGPTRSQCLCFSLYCKAVVPELPSRMPCFLCREELGEYFAVDIGGTNYRVIYVKLSPEKSKVVRTAAACSRPVLSCNKCIFLSCSCGGGFTTPWWSAAPKLA